MASELSPVGLRFASEAELEKGLHEGRWLHAPWGETWQMLACLCLNQPNLATLAAKAWWEAARPLDQVSMPLEGPSSDRAGQLAPHDLGMTLSLEAAFSSVRMHLNEVTRLEDLLEPLAPWVIGAQAGVKEKLWRMTHQQLSELRQKLSHDASLKALLQWLGRTLEGKAKGEDVEHGPERQGLSQGQNLREVLANEWALLSEPETELLFWARYVSHQLSVFDPHGELVGTRGGKRRGPVLVCVDTSASMQRDLEAQAKALTLELVHAMQSRRVEVVLFGGVGARLWCSFAAGKTSADALFAFLMHSFGRATDLSGVLRDALLRLGEENLSQADLVVLSDGRAPLDAELTARMQARRVEGLRVAVIYPEPSGESFEPTLAAFSDLDAVLKAGKLHPRQGDWQALMKR